MNNEKTSKVALVTGATSGLGAAIAAALAAEGWRVYGTGRNPAAETRPGEGRFPRFLPLDVRSGESIARALAQVVAGEGGIDLLVACAGSGIAGSVEDSAMAAIETQMDVNFLGVVRTVKACLPSMRERRRGKIIVIGSLAGRTGMPYQAFYSASKFALEGFVESLRYEVAPLGIQVCIVEPGDFRTGFTSARRKPESVSEAYRDSFLRVIGIQEHDERNGSDPAKAASKIVALADTRRMPVRASVGSAFQRLGIFLKRVIPAAWFEFLYKVYYKLG
jgi:NAD(P)-dependent dehydrogenase (short-subunit alcohol dehydrogenase family)